MLQKLLKKTAKRQEDTSMGITASTLFSFRQNFRVKYVLISSSKISCGKRSHQSKHIVKHNK